MQRVELWNGMDQTVPGGHNAGGGWVLGHKLGRLLKEALLTLGGWVVGTCRTPPPLGGEVFLWTTLPDRRLRRVAAVAAGLRLDAAAQSMMKSN